MQGNNYPLSTTAGTAEELDIESCYNYYYLLYISSYIYISNLGFDIWQWAPNGQPVVPYPPPGANPEVLPQTNNRPKRIQFGSRSNCSSDTPC